jgi:hypothetical protein
MSTINKQVLKNLIKECLIETLTEIDVIKVIVSEAVKAAVSVVITESIKPQQFTNTTNTNVAQTQQKQQIKTTSKKIQLEEEIGTIGIEFSEGDKVGKLDIFQVLKEDMKIPKGSNEQGYVGEQTRQDPDELLKAMGLLG